MIKFARIAIMPLFLCSCLSVPVEKEPEILVSEIIGVDDNIISPHIVEVLDSVFIFGMNTETVYGTGVLRGAHIVKTGDFVKMGDGPDELQDPVIKHIAEEKSFLVSGKMLLKNRMFRCVDASVLKEGEKVETPLPCMERMHATDISWISDSIFILVGGSPTGNNALSYMTGDTILPIQGLDFPEDGIETDSRVKRYVYGESDILKQPGRNRFVWSGRAGRMLAFFSLNENTAMHVEYVLSDFPSYSPSPTGLYSYTDETKWGFNVYATSNYVYLLTTEFPTRRSMIDALQSNGTYKGYPASCFRDRVMVYTWDGEQIGDYLLDRPLTGFFVVPDGDEYLYAASMDKVSLEPVFLRFKLNHKR